MQRLRIEEIAKAKGFSRARLSREANVDTDVLKKLYKEPDCNPMLNTLRKIAVTLGVSIRDLFEE